MNEPENTSDQAARSADRAGFCKFLRKQREIAKLSLDDIARVTRIPERSLQHLESGRFEDLPADVFVRGFLRSYATCIGLDPDDALRRYTECGLAPAPVASDEAHRVARHLRGEPKVARGTANPAPAPSASASSATSAAPTARPPSPAKKRKGKKRRKPRSNQDGASERQASAPSAKPEAAEPAKAAKPVVEAVAATNPVPAAAPMTASVEPVEVAEPIATQPMVAPPRPVLVIDDADPDAAERAAERARKRTDESRVTFLPAALLDADDGSRRGALTLAVIILVIVATITMSYLLRRPSSPRDGVTELGPARILVGDDGAFDSTIQV